ncbi:hypothetical protein COB57_00485 [Candidatus Peregrinibacteria bacterium]|nr:MAG: hypothetical protein COB57_00485 [Candidatus Peregrinibacteria bacterium]
MNTSIVYTSSMKKPLFQWVKKTSQQRHTSKKQIIEEALSLYKKEIKKKQLEETFKRAAQDYEIINMAEEGIEDSLDQLNKIS